MTMITDPDDYFTKGCGRCDRFATPDCSTRRWTLGLNTLRRICLDAGLSEHVKWAHPCYMHAGRNIALIGAFRDDFRFNFMNPSLLKDPEGVLERNGPNTRTAGMLRFTDNAGPDRMEPIIRATLAEAMGYAEAGVKAAKVETTFDLPDELVEALDADPELAEAFRALTPGRQRSYVINLNAAKRSATRSNRVHKFRARIIAGKGATER